MLDSIIADMEFNTICLNIACVLGEELDYIRETIVEHSSTTILSPTEYANLIYLNLLDGWPLQSLFGINRG